MGVDRVLFRRALRLVAARRRRRREAEGAPRPPSERTAVADLRAACDAGGADGRIVGPADAADLEQGGGRAARVVGAAGVARRLGGEALAGAVARMQRAGYGDGAEPWRGAELWRAFGEARRDGRRRSDGRPDVLPSLYPRG